MDGFIQMTFFSHVHCMFSLKRLGMVISSFAPNVEAAGAIGPPIGKLID